jgi:hypothetical protein
MAKNFFLSPALAFRPHQGQSGTADHGFIFLALPTYGTLEMNFSQLVIK